MAKIEIMLNKSLKLTNVVMTEVPFESFQDIGIAIEQLENYIRSKGLQPVGPHIQYMSMKVEGETLDEVIIKIFRQASGVIHHVEKPYVFSPIYRVKNCLYARYIGPEEYSKYAYDKLNVTAFEEDIPLKGDSYTIFVGEKNEDVITDVFMERSQS